MEQSGLEPRDLVPFIGSRNRVHEVLNRKRPLTLKMIRRLQEGLAGYSGGVPHQDRTRSPREVAAVKIPTPASSC